MSSLSRMADCHSFPLALALASVGLFGWSGAILAQPSAIAAKEPPSLATYPLSVPATTLFPAHTKAPPDDPAARQYLNNPQAIATGAQLFNWFNCSGCHFHGAGGMGPPFMNGGHWIYGGQLDQIYASIDQGRPNGMPSWGQKLSSQQIWQLAAYVKALSEPDEQKETGGPPLPPNQPAGNAAMPSPGGQPQ